MHRYWSRMVLGASLVVLVGCSDYNSSPTAPTVLNLAGNWAGTMTGVGADTAITWAAAQTVTNATGAAVASVQGFVLNGTMTGTVSSTMTLTLTLNHPSGCTMTATFTPTTPSATLLSGGISFAAGCPAGTGTNTGQLRLTK